MDYLERFDTQVLEGVANRPVCRGRIDCYNEPVEILGFRTPALDSELFFFLPPTEVRLLGSFVTVRDGTRFFTGYFDAPFRPDAPLSPRYHECIIDWLTGRDIGQRVVWYSSRFASDKRSLLTPETREVAARHAPD